MGYAIANELSNRGAEVILVSGPTSLKISNNNLTKIDVISAEQMFNECMKIFPEVDGAVMSAAVADFTPVDVFSAKQKSNDVGLNISLRPTKDIAQHLGDLKSDNQFLVGFALETNNEEENALKKIRKKNLDFVVLNSLNDLGAGFKHDTNKISILFRDGSKKVYELKSKNEVAKDIIDTLASIIK